MELEHAISGKPEKQEAPIMPEVQQEPRDHVISNTEKEDNEKLEIQEKSPQEIYKELGDKLFKKYGTKLGDIANSSGGMYPCEIKGEVLEVIDPKDWVTYLGFANAAHEIDKGIKFKKREGHPHILHAKEKSQEKPEIIVADDSLKEKLKNDWPYDNFSYEQWEANGFLITKEGMPSKLKRKLYELVRMDEFKSWFGDWEKNGEENVSKMIDKDTGEPQAFYRGDKSLFKDGFLVKDEEARTPDREKIKHEVGISGPETMKIQSRNQGVFFTDNEKVALDYGKSLEALTLGKFGLDPLADHPATFPKLKKAIESFAGENPLFWKEIFDYRLNSSSVSEKEREDEFRRFCNRVGLKSEDRNDLWSEISTGERIKSPSHYMDVLIEAGAFEEIMNSFEEMSVSKDTDQETNMLKRSPWLITLRRLIREYKAEPLALSTVFIRSLNLKRARWIDVDVSLEIYKARIDGHDAFIHEKGVGKGVPGVEAADEIVVYALKDIWVAEKRPLADEAIEEDSNRRYF